MINKLTNDFLKRNVHYSVYGNDTCGDTLQDLLCNVFAKINEMIEDVNSYTTAIDKVLKWIYDNGVEDAVKNELNEMLENGKFNDIISNVIFLDLRNAIEKNSQSIKGISQDLENVHEKIDKNANDIKKVNDTINTEFEKINSKIDIKMEEFKKLIDEVNSVVEKFNDKINKVQEENKKANDLQDEEIKTLNDRTQVLEFDISKCNPTYLFKCKLAEGSVTQATVRDLFTGEYFVTQVWYGPEGTSESYTITRLDRYGNYVDWMRCKYGGHGTTIGIENVGGITHIWANWDITDGQGNYIGNKLVRFPYQSRKTLESSDPSIKQYDTFEKIYVIPVVDQINDLIAFRVKYSEENQVIRVYKLSEFKKGINNKLSEFKIPWKYNYLQGLSILEDKFYLRTGDTNSANWDDLLIEFDWKTGKEIQHIECDFHLDKDFFDVDNFREPEGVFAYRDPKTKLISILCPLTVGEGGHRQYPIWSYNQLGASGDMLGDLFKNVQKFEMCMEGGTEQYIPKHIQALKDLTNAGWYYAPTGEMSKFNDVPKEVQNSGCHIFVSPNNERVGGEGKALYQVIVRNGISSFDRFYRCRNNKGEVGSWFKDNVTKVE